MAYILQKSVTKNITQESKNRFLKNNGLLKGYESTKITFEDFITEALNNGSLLIEELNEYLFDELFFGQQRNTYIYKMYSYRKEILSLQKLLEVIDMEFGVKEENMVRITNVYSNNDNKEKRELVAFKVVKSHDSNKVKKIKLLFSKKVRVQLKNGTNTENSYVPVELDLEKKLW